MKLGKVDGISGHLTIELDARLGPFYHMKLYRYVHEDEPVNTNLIIMDSERLLELKKLIENILECGQNSS